jgi:hypothetical protein
MWSDVSGTFEVDVERVSYGGYGGFGGSNFRSIATIDGGSAPRFDNTYKMRDSALNLWNTYVDGYPNPPIPPHTNLSLLAGDILKFNVLFSDLVSQVTCVLWVEKV